MRDMYAGASEEERRAMMKSFVCILVLFLFIYTNFIHSTSQEGQFCHVTGKMLERDMLIPSPLQVSLVGRKMLYNTHLFLLSSLLVG